MKPQWMENAKYASQLSFLFIHPPLSFGSYANVPLGIGTLAAMLEKLGVPVACKDYQVEPFEEKELLDLIEKRGVNVVGISAMTNQVKKAYTYIKRIKERFPHIKGIIGGHHATVMPEEALGNGFDIAYVGEAEETLMQTLPYLAQDALELAVLKGIPGLAFWDGDQPCFTGMAPPLKDLDVLPFAARHLFPFPQKYTTQMRMRSGYSTHIITSRGCIGRCFFCSNLYKTVAGRSPKNVVDEIEMLYHDYGIRQIFIQDDFSSFTDERIYAICAELKKRNLDLDWSMSNTRAESVSFNLFKTMREAGCVGVAFGIESGHPKIRKKIGKRNSLEDVVTAVRYAKKAGLLVGGFYIFGFPFETMDDMRETLRFAKKLNTHLVTFAVFCPFPGSPSYQYLKKKGKLLTEDWDQYATHGRLLFESDNFTAQEIASFRRKAYLEYHFSPRYIFSLIPAALRQFRPIMFLEVLKFILSFALDYRPSFAKRKPATRNGHC